MSKKVFKKFKVKTSALCHFVQSNECKFKKLKEFKDFVAKVFNN